MGESVPAMYSRLKIKSGDRFERNIEVSIPDFDAGCKFLKESLNETIAGLNENGWDVDNLVIEYVISVKQKEPS